MKPNFIILLILGISVFTSKSGISQVIANNETSSNYLANQIAMSSGMPAENYRTYAKGLARTLSLLTPMQQAEVFGVGGAVASTPGALLGEEVSGGESQATGNILADILAGAENSPASTTSSSESGTTGGEIAMGSSPSGTESSPSTAGSISGDSSTTTTASTGGTSGATGGTTTASTGGTTTSTSGTSGTSGGTTASTKSGTSATAGWGSMTDFMNALLNAAKKFMGL